MNHESLVFVKMDVNELYKAIEALPKEIQANFTVSDACNSSHDALLTWKVNNHTVHFPVEHKIIHRKESLRHYQEQHGTHGVLLCNYLSDFLRDYCHQHHINYIDEAGNTRLVDEGLYILIQGKKAPVQPTAAPVLTLGIMKCLFALFVDNNLLTKPYSEIAQKADISLGMVSKAINYLIDNKHIPKEKSQRRLLDKQELIYQWLRSYDSVLRPKMAMLTLNAPQPWEQLEVGPDELWSGEIAASTLTEYLTPEHGFLYTRQPLNQKIRQYRARPDKNGNLTVASTFWGESLDITPFATALLSTAELLYSQDSRNQEIAEIINDQYLHLKQLP